MSDKLKWQTVPDSLAEVLVKLMQLEELMDFRLVGGTSLSLQLGHRESNDIDLFTDKEYGSVDFSKIDAGLRANFNFVSDDQTGNFSFGIMCLAGNSEPDSVKVDLFYTDTFIRDPLVSDKIRLASLEDIAAMKLEIISNGGRKRDFWDIHELLDIYTISDLLGFLKERNPYLELEELIVGLTNFESADQEKEPVCLRGKYWELIKIDLKEVVKDYKAS